MNVLRLERVSKHYITEGNPVVALEDISLEFQAGEFVALVGRSGCGKSTLLNLAGAMDFRHREPSRWTAWLLPGWATPHSLACGARKWGSSFSPSNYSRRCRWLRTWNCRCCWLARPTNARRRSSNCDVLRWTATLPVCRINFPAARRNEWPSHAR